MSKPTKKSLPKKSLPKKSPAPQVLPPANEDPSAVEAAPKDLGSATPISTPPPALATSEPRVPVWYATAFMRSERIDAVECFQELASKPERPTGRWVKKFADGSRAEMVTARFAGDM